MYSVCIYQYQESINKCQILKYFNHKSISPQTIARISEWNRTYSDQKHANRCKRSEDCPRIFTSWSRSKVVHTCSSSKLILHTLLHDFFTRTPKSYTWHQKVTCTVTTTTFDYCFLMLIDTRYLPIQIWFAFVAVVFVRKVFLSYCWSINMVH